MFVVNGVKLLPMPCLFLVNKRIKEVLKKDSPLPPWANIIFCLRSPFFRIYNFLSVQWPSLQNKHGQKYAIECTFSSGGSIGAFYRIIFSRKRAQFQYLEHSQKIWDQVGRVYCMSILVVKNNLMLKIKFIWKDFVQDL